MLQANRLHGDALTINGKTYAENVAKAKATNAAVILHLRESTLVDQENELGNLSLTLAEQADRSFQSVDLVISSVADEIAAEGIFFRRAEGIVVVDEQGATGRQRSRIRMDRRRHPILHDFLAGFNLPPERCDLDDFAAKKHVRQAKASTDEAAVAEQFPNLIGQRIGRTRRPQNQGSA